MRRWEVANLVAAAKLIRNNAGRPTIQVQFTLSDSTRSTTRLLNQIPDPEPKFVVFPAGVECVFGGCRR